MKKKILYGLFAFTALSFVNTGCKRGDDFTISPNSPSKVTPGLLLTAIQVSTFNSYEGNLTKNASILVQQNTGVEGQALPINNYTLAENEFDNQWSQLYQALYSCKDLQSQFGNSNPYFSGITNVLEAFNWGMLTDLWGDIPFSEAIQGAQNYNAKYDDQETVIKGIISLCDQAITKLQQPEGNNDLLPGVDDLVFGGNVEQWLKVAYSLKARYLNRLSNKGSYNAATILDCISKGIQSPSDDFISVHGAKTTEFNQWFDFQNNRQNYMLASLTLVDSMQLRLTDVRLNAYFSDLDTLGIIGSPVENPSSEASAWGDYLAGGPQVGVRLLSYVEMKFIEAEVKARQSATDVADVLNDAIKASCTDVTNGAYTGDDIATYTAANVNLSRVMYEKWIALFGSMEPYNDYRKTGFPALRVNPNGRMNVIPKRFPTPQSERVNNTNAKTPALTEKVWFAL